MKKKDLNLIELATWTHGEDYQLIHCGFLPISIARENRLNYYQLDRYIFIYQS